MYAPSAALFSPYSVTLSGNGTPSRKAVCTSARTLRPKELALSSIYACVRAAMLSPSALVLGLGVQRFLQRFDRLAVMTAVELRQIERE